MRHRRPRPPIRGLALRAPRLGLLIVIGALAALIVIAAPISDVSATMAPTQLRAQDTPSHAGNWQGTTAQGLAVTFTIVDDALVSFVVEYQPDGCDRVFPLTGNWQRNHSRVVDGKLKAPFSLGSIFSATFDSESSSSGEVVLDDQTARILMTGCPGPGTTIGWTANRE